MSFNVYHGDTTRIEWKTKLPGQPIASPGFFLSDLNCKLQFSRNPTSHEDAIWIMKLLLSNAAPFGDVHVKMRAYINKSGRLILVADSLVRIRYYANSEQILQIRIKENSVMYEGNVAIVFDFCFKNGSSLKDLMTATQVKEEIFAPSSNACTESLVQDLQKFLEEGSQYDIELKCGAPSIFAHKTILSARSTVFAAMLRNDMQEGRSGVVNIADMEFHVLQYFVRYIYCGVLPELTVELASHLFKIGDKYAVTALMKRCARFLVESLTVENACEFLVLADDHRDDEFKESVVFYIVDKEVPKKYGNWDQFCRSRPYLGLEVLNRYVLKK